MAADIAEFGVKIKAPEGVDQHVAAFQKIDTASKRTSDNIVKHAGAFEKSTAALAKHSAGAMSLLRTLGPLGTHAMELAERLERAAVRAETLAVKAAGSASQQKVLENAFRSGAIAAATMEAAQARLTNARQAAIAIEREYARAQMASKVAQEEARIAAANVREQRLIVATTKQTASPFSGDLEREQRRLNQAQSEALVTSNAYRSAVAEEKALKASLAGANKEVAASQELMNVANKGAVSGFGVTAAVIGALVVTLITLAAGIYAVEKAWHLFKESIAEASKIEQARVGLEVLIGNAAKAADVLEGLREISLKSGGRFSVEGLSDAAVKMSALGVATGNLIPRLEAFAQLASRTTGATIEGIVQIYDRAVDSITSGIGLSTRELRSFTNQGVNLAEMVAHSMHISADAAKDLILNHKLTVDQLNAAFESIAHHDGAMERRANTFKVLVGTLKTGWDEILARFAEPIMVSLEPILARLVKAIPVLEHLAEAAGEAIAHVIDELTAIVGNEGWAKGAEAMAAKMANTIATVLVTMATKIGPAFAEAFFAGFAAAMNQKFSSLGNFFNPYAGMAEFGEAALAKLLKDLLLVVPEITAMGNAVRTGVSAAQMGVNSTDNFAVGTKGETDFDKYKTDLQIINDYWTEYNMIQAKAQSETERTRRVIELEAKTAKELSDPKAYAKDFTTIQGRWEAMEAARVKASEEADFRIKSGQASVFDAMLTGIDKVLHAWGNAAQKMEKAIGDIANALVNDISSGLTDIITGTKDAETGFREMAVSILRDIAQIIIKMEVEILLQTILNALRGTSSGGGVGTGARGAMGGAIMGPSHSAGGVHLEAEGGEFIMRKDRVRSEGMDKMYMLNEGRAMIVPKYGDGGPIEPPILPPPPTGNYPGVGGNYPRWNDVQQAMDAMRNGDIPASTGFRNRDVGNFSVSRNLFADDSYNPRTWSPGREFPGDAGSDVPAISPRPNPTFTFGNDPYTGMIGNDIGYRPTATANFGGLGVNYGNIVPGYSGARPDPAVLTGTPPVGYTNLNTGTGQLVMWDGTQWTNVGPVPTPGVVPDPSRNMVNTFLDPATGMQLHVTGYDPGTGTTFYQDNQGNSYAGGPSSPRERQPGGAQGTATATNPGINFGAIFSANPGLNNPAGERALSGGANPNSLIGHAQFDSHAAGLMQMAFQSYGGNPNNMGTTTDAGHTIFQAGGDWHGRVEDGMVVHVPGGFGKGPRDPRWVFPSQAESWKGGFSYADKQHVEAYASWLKAHNPWYYGPGGVLEQQRAAAATAAGQLPTATFSSAPVLQGPTNIGPEIPKYHTGGIVGESGFVRMATGGAVDERLINAKVGEGVLTRGQMSAIGAGMSGPSAVHVEINVDSHDNVTSSSSDADMSDEDWKRLAKVVEGMTIQTLQKQRRYRGAAYQSRTGAPA